MVDSSANSYQLSWNASKKFEASANLLRLEVEVNFLAAVCE
jgi:hypothetical protein